MLTPGEYLVAPAPAGPPRGHPTDARTEPQPPPAPAVRPEEPERDSFLRRLLRALGAVHT